MCTTCTWYRAVRCAVLRSRLGGPGASSNPPSQVSQPSSPWPAWQASAVTLPNTDRAVCCYCPRLLVLVPASTAGCPVLVCGYQLIQPVLRTSTDERRAATRSRGAAAPLRAAPPAALRSS
eukprot:122142-Rhodomonas_salina.1